MKLFRKIMLFLLVIFSMLFLLVFTLDRWVSYQTYARVYHDVSSTPAREVGLVLGTSKYIGRTLNAYYTYRVTAAQELYFQEKIDALLLSGDNAHRSYNEPWTMKRDMLASGIPESRIFLDYAGFRTLDSVIRANKVFDADKFTIITQGFHCERALFIADFYDIDAICFAVDNPGGLSSLKIRLREMFARLKAFLDIYILNQQPKFLGPKETIYFNVAN